MPAARPVLASSGRPSGTSQPTLGEADLRVLFVGNSLTYANDMPGLVHTLAESAEFYVWPDATRSHAFDAARDSYLGAAQAVDGLFLPAGDVWRAAWARDETLSLYGPDGFHPSRGGSFAAAIGPAAQASRTDVAQALEGAG